LHRLSFPRPLACAPNCRQARPTKDVRVIEILAAKPALRAPKPLDSRNSGSWDA